MSVTGRPTTTGPITPPEPEMEESELDDVEDETEPDDPELLDPLLLPDRFDPDDLDCLFFGRMVILRPGKDQGCGKESIQYLAKGREGLR